MWAGRLAVASVLSLIVAEMGVAADNQGWDMQQVWTQVAQVIYNNIR